jgi:general secretion pathway protein K
MLSQQTQKGVALITALLIVALATIISVRIATHLQLDVRRTGNMLASEQAFQYVMAAENLLSIALYEDRKDNNVDYYGDPNVHTDRESWSDLYEFPFENALIRSQAIDLQACFNLNSLTSDGAVDIIAQDRFKRLAVNAGNDAEIPVRTDLSQAIIDWIDNDDGQPQTTTPDGAEDGYYMNLENPYRTANTPIQSVSELRLIKGFEDNAIFEAISPLVCAFGIPASINVNTAPEEVLNSLADDIDGAGIVERRTEDPFDDVNEFLGFKDLKKTIKQTQGLSVSSEYFLLETEIRLGQSRTLMYSILHRDENGNTRVMSRSQGAY